MRRYFLIFVTLFLLGKESQSQMTAGMVDSLTYRLYLETKWKQLLSEAEKAIRGKVDFYYLRVRAGIAAYELGKYRKAVSHLETAYHASRDDDFVNSYYYYALLMSGRKDEAVALADRLSPGMLKKTGIRRKDLFTGIGVESLVSWNAGYSGLLSGDIGSESAFSNYRTLLKQQFYQGIAFDHHILPGFDLYHHFSHIGIDRMEQFKSTVNFLDTLKSTRTVQYQYFINGRFAPGNGWALSAAFSKLWGESQYHIPEYISPWNYNLSESVWEIHDYVFSVAIAKELLWMRPKLGAGIGRINGYRQLQANLQLIVYPAGNLNFYLTPEAYLHFDESETGAKFVFGQGAGIKTGPFWLSLDYAVGNMKNFFSGDGLVVYNMPESIRQKKGISVWLPLINYRLETTIRFVRSEKKGTTFVYTDLDHFVPENYRFNENSILISIKWNL